MLEQLESRMLLAVTVANRILLITGTAGDDQIALDVRRHRDPIEYAIWKIRIVVNGVQIAQVDQRRIDTIRIDALAGNDLVTAQVSDPCHIEGAAGKDTLSGGQYSDTLVGGNGDDLLYGENGDDLLSGGPGRDRLRGDDDHPFADGDDTLGGGDGDDVLWGGGGADRFEGGRGTDTADYSDRDAAVLIVLGTIVLPDDWPVYRAPPAQGYVAKPYPQFSPQNLAGAGWLEGDSLRTDVENALGGKGNDVLWGSDGDNMLAGGAGDDQLYGGRGADTLYGHDGADRLYSADSRDAMPFINPIVYRERIHGGAGRDFAMVDWADREQVIKCEKVESLGALTS